MLNWLCLFHWNYKIYTEFINSLLAHIFILYLFSVMFLTWLYVFPIKIFSYLFYCILNILPCVKSFLHQFLYFYWYLIHLRNLFCNKLGLNLNLFLACLNDCSIIWFYRVRLHVFWLVLNATLVISCTLGTVTAFHLCLNLLCSIHLSTLAQLLWSYIICFKTLTSYKPLFQIFLTCWHIFDWLVEF